MSRSHFIQSLDRYAEEGRTVLLWLRDDDAVEATEALMRLLDLSLRWQAPITVAAIPAYARPSLAEALRPVPDISVAVHGWDHANHAPAGEKSQELGPHRRQDLVLKSLQEGLSRITSLFGEFSLPLLVPPWNRIDQALVGQLPNLGFKALSVFGPEKAPSPLALVNTHLDIIDWKGNRGGRSLKALYAEAAARLTSEQGPQTCIGVLTHHLVHDLAAWDFLDDFLELTAAHPACRWVPVRDLI